MKKILITGASGFVGYHLAQELSHKKYKLYLFDTQKRKHNLPGEFIKGDIRKPGQIIPLSSKVDGIIHLAAVSRVSLSREFPLRCVDTNIMGTANILEGMLSAKRKPWLIIASSCEGNFNWGQKSPSLDFKKFTNLYVISKFITELLCFQYSRDYNLRILVLRFSDIYGSVYGNQERVLSKLILKSLNNEDIEINNPSKEFDFIYYKDLVRGIYLATKYMVKNKKTSFFKQIALCTGKTINLAKLTRLIFKETKSHSRISYNHTVSAKDNPRVSFSPKEAQKLINFKPNISFRQGLLYTVKDFREIIPQK